MFEPVLSQDDEKILFDPEKQYTQQFLDSIIENGARVPTSEFKQMLLSDEELKGWTIFYNRMATLLYHDKKFDSTLHYADLAIKTYEDSKVKRVLDEQQLRNVYYYKAKAYRDLEDYDNSTKNFHIALDYAKKHPYVWVAYIYSGIAWNHYENGDDDLALEYLLISVNDTMYQTRTRSMISSYKTIGDLYANRNQIDSSFYYYNKTLKRLESADDKSNLSATYGAMGYLYNKIGNKDSLAHYFRLAAETNQELGMQSYKGAELTMNIYQGYSEFTDRKYNEAIESMTAAKTILLEQPAYLKADLEAGILIFETLDELYQIIGDSQKLKQNFNESTAFLNKYWEEQLSEETQKIEVAYQTKEKDQDIARLTESMTQQNTIIKQQRTIFFALGGILLLLGGLGYLFWNQRKLKNQYEKENLEQRLLRSQMNPHFIGNSMNTVVALIDKKSDDAKSYVNKLSNLFRLVLTNSREEFVSLDDELATLRSFMELQSNFSVDFDFELKVDENIDREQHIIPPMLIQPFIENSILHGFSGNGQKGKVLVNITKDKEGILHCEITDNGVGYEERSTPKSKDKRRSISGDIVKERLEIMKKKFKVNAGYSIANTGSGTRVDLNIPYLLDV